MKLREPLAKLATHEVVNMPPHMGDQDLWRDDVALKEWAAVFGAKKHEKLFEKAGKNFGADETFEKANQANRHSPELRAFDRYGMRINTAEFHPAYHDLMELAMSHGVHNFAWRHDGDGEAGHVGNAILNYMFCQPEGGVACPMAMAYSVPPTLKATKSVADAWMPKILSCEYDRRDIPAAEKKSALLGMFMTEKQGGSDVRANSTVAVPVGGKTGEGEDYHLTGHKFFCSAPMCDGFLVLARTEGKDVSCFLVPRWRPDGTRNNLDIQRFKDKLGNRSNASSEMEFHDTFGTMIGEEGRGIRTIIDMVNGNRIFCAMSSAGMMRQALVQALHHTGNRSAFQKRLIQQPLMRNVLADLAIETEAALALGLRVANAMDNAGKSESEAALARVGTAIAKYWNCKRCPPMVVEALECHGGPGYIEESIMPRLYREAPLNSIWEGSGNIMGLDVLRAMHREPKTMPAFMAEIEAARGRNDNLDRAIDALADELNDTDNLEGRMRIVTEMMARVWQGVLLTGHAPAPVGEAFCASRLGSRYSGAFGTLPRGVDIDSVIDRAVA